MLKKITFFTGSLKMGGPQRVMVTLSEKFIEDGVKVKFVTTVTNEVEYNINSNIAHIGVPNLSKNRLLKTIHKIMWIRKVLRDDDSDVIISFWHNVNMYLMIASAFLGKKIIISERNDPHNEPGNLLMRKVRNFLYEFAGFIVFQTPDAKEYYSKRIQSKSEIIPNPINEKLPMRYEGKRKKEIVNFCRFTPQKNIFMLIDAFYMLNKEYNDYTLKIYGRGPLKDEIIEYIRKLNISKFVKVENFSTNIHEEIKGSAMFVSSSNYEGISNSMLESLAMGIPTICTDCPIGGARMCINSYENGILVPVGDKESLYRAMKYIIDNPEQAEKISINSTKIKESLSINNIYSKWVKTINDLIND